MSMKLRGCSDPDGLARAGGRPAPGISIPWLVPPIAIPGTQENRDWARSAAQQIQDAIDPATAKQTMRPNYVLSSQGSRSAGRFFSLLTSPPPLARCLSLSQEMKVFSLRNRIRGLLTQIHPALERVLGPRLDHPAILDLLERHPSPAQLSSVSEKQLAHGLSKLAPRMGKAWAAEIAQALTEQTLIVQGTQAAAIVLPRLAHQLNALRRQREEVAQEVERLVHAHPLYAVLTSMPGFGVRTAARLLTEVACRAFTSSAHLAAYAGLAPVTRRSGSSIRGEQPSRRGNKTLKRALFLSAFAALRDPISRAYYARKISQGKRHDQALIALARRRCDVLFAVEFGICMKKCLGDECSSE